MTHCILEVLLNYELELNLVGCSLTGLEENGDDKTYPFWLSKTPGHSGIHSDVPETPAVYERGKESSPSKKERK